MPQRIPRLAAPCEQVITRRLNDALRRGGSFLTFVGSFSGHGTSDFCFVIFGKTGNGEESYVYRVRYFEFWRSAHRRV